MSEEELIAEAYRRYPIGTWFKSIHTDNGAWRKVEPYSFDNDPDPDWELRYMLTNDGNIWCAEGIGIGSFKGGICSNPYVMYNGKWAPVDETHKIKLILEKYDVS